VTQHVLGTLRKSVILAIENSKNYSMDYLGLEKFRLKILNQIR